MNIFARVLSLVLTSLLCTSGLVHAYPTDQAFLLDEVALESGMPSVSELSGSAMSTHVAKSQAHSETASPSRLVRMQKRAGQLVQYDIPDFAKKYKKELIITAAVTAAAAALVTMVVIGGVVYYVSRQGKLEKTPKGQADTNKADKLAVQDPFKQYPELDNMQQEEVETDWILLTNVTREDQRLTEKDTPLVRLQQTQQDASNLVPPQPLEPVPAIGTNSNEPEPGADINQARPLPASEELNLPPAPSSSSGVMLPPPPPPMPAGFSTKPVVINQSNRSNSSRSAVSPALPSGGYASLQEELAARVKKINPIDVPVPDSATSSSSQVSANVIQAPVPASVAPVKNAQANVSGASSSSSQTLPPPPPPMPTTLTKATQQQPSPVASSTQSNVRVIPAVSPGAFQTELEIRLRARKLQCENQLRSNQSSPVQAHAQASSSVPEPTPLTDAIFQATNAIDEDSASNPQNSNQVYSEQDQDTEWAQPGIAASVSSEEERKKREDAHATYAAEIQKAIDDTLNYDTDLTGTYTFILAADAAEKNSNEKRQLKDPKIELALSDGRTFQLKAPGTFDFDGMFIVVPMERQQADIYPVVGKGGKKPGTRNYRLNWLESSTGQAIRGLRFVRAEPNPAERESKGQALPLTGSLFKMPDLLSLSDLNTQSTFIESSAKSQSLSAEEILQQITARRSALLDEDSDSEDDFND